MNLTGYALIGALIAFMGLGLVAYHYKVEARDAIVERDAAKRDRDAAVATNKHNEEIMGKLKVEKERAERLQVELAEEIETANKTALAMANKLSELRTKDADVDAYLRLPVPPALRGMYSNTKAAGGNPVSGR